ncbi:hypothetical protein KP509_12G004000 [Ceratopteris richardii]|uniref:Uncharacterized protein n=1 Tax=Ceratopteris richardii TaxID=49495 RepID=A0A8T2TLR3_CERRI|nr:hypothetical protein KP509_12G004000 [Ceratopteris richardii]
MNVKHNGLEGSNGLGADKPARDNQYVPGVPVHRPTCIAGAEIERCSWAVCGDDCPPCSDYPKGAEGSLAQFLDRVHEPKLPCVLADSTSCINVSDSLILQNDMHPEAESGAPAMTALIANSKRKSKCSLLREFDSEGEKLSGEHERDCAHRFQRCKEGDCERTDLKEVPDSLDGEPDLTAMLDSTSLIEEPQVKGSQTEHDAPYVHRTGSNSADGVGVLPVLKPAECLSDSLLTRRTAYLTQKPSTVMDIGEVKAEGKAVINIGEFKAEGKADMQRSSRTESGNECLSKEEESRASMCQEQNHGQQGEKGGTKDQQVSISQIDANRLSGLVSESEDLNQLIIFSTGKSKETDEFHVSVPESKRADDSSMQKIAAACELRMLFAEKHVMDLRKSLASWGECLRDQEREVDFMIMEHCKEYNRLHGMTTELKDRQKCIMSLRRRLAENYQSTDSVDDAYKSVLFKAEDDLESPSSRKCNSKSNWQNLTPVEKTLWNRNNIEVVQAELEYEESSLTRQEESVKHVVNGRLEQDRRLSSAVKHLEETQQHVDFLKRRLEFIQAVINSRTRQVPGFSKAKESTMQVERPLTNTLDKAFGYVGNRIASNLRACVSRATSKQLRNRNPEAKSAANEAIRDGFSSVSFQTLMQTLASLLQRFCRCDGLMKTQTTQAIH